MTFQNKFQIHFPKLANWFIYTAIFGCSLLLLAIPIHISINAFDEGTILNNAYRIASGDSPYQDFWTGYMPGQYYAIGFLYKLFGTSVLVERWWDIFVRAIFLVEIFIFTQGKFPIGYRIFVWLIAVLLLAGSGSFGNPLFPGLSGSLLSILMLEKYFRSKQITWIFYSGLFIGITFWFRWDFGLYAGFGNCLALFFYLKTISNDQDYRFRMTLKVAKIFISGILLAVVPLIILIFIQGGLDEFINQVFIFPATIMQDFRRKPHPSIFLPIQLLTGGRGALEEHFSDLFTWFFFYFPILLAFLFLVWIRSGLRKKTLTGQFYSWLAFGSFGLSLIAYSLSRFDYPHALPVSLFVCPITILLLGSIENFQHRLRRTIVFPTAVVLLTVCYAFFPTVVLTNAILSYSPFRCFSDLPKAQCIYLDQDQYQAVKYIDSVTDNNEAIFIGNTRHDQILTNDISLYFLVGLPGATPYYALEPGIATTSRVQNEIIADIEQKQVQWIVLVDSPLAEESNQSSISSQVHLLDEYIDHNYRLVKSFGRFSVLQAASKD